MKTQNTNSKAQIKFILPRRAFVLFFGILALLAAGMLAFVYLPAAEITIAPAVRERSAEQEILLSAAATEPDFVRFVLPARLLSADASHEQAFERPGDVTVQDFAKGEVELINTRDEVQELLPKTHLRHEATGVFFLTDFPVAIPAQGSVRMTVTAKERGEAGNVPAGKFIIDKLAPELQPSIYAESKAAFTGGVAVESALPQEEIDQAKAEVLKAASEQARVELSSQVGGASVRPELIAITPIEETVSVQAGSKAQSFTIKTTVQARAFLPDDNDLLGLTLLSLRRQPQADEEFVSYDPGSFSVKIVQANFERGEARLTGAVRGKFASKIGPATLDPTPLLGLSPEEVQAYFKDNPAVGNVEVDLSPFWVRTVPGRRGAVEVVVSTK